jgi:peptidoglycan-N-acetylglucosamine deacetylase
MMRIVIVVFAALLTLGLVAFGVIVAQKATDSVPLTVTAAARVSSSQNTGSANSGKAPLQLGEAVKAAAPFASIAVAQNDTMAVASAFPAPALAPRPFAACNNPDALGLSRVIEIDTTGGPAFGTEHFKQYDFLRDKEVALTFDDGPWPGNTSRVLKALQDNCTKATFFEIGEHATWRPDLAKELAAAGMTIGSHTWSHCTDPKTWSNQR